MSDQPLKLRAEDPDDVTVLAACLQDALVPVAGLDYQRSQRRFAMAAHRFRWENCDQSKADCGAFERVNCGVTFEEVEAVRLRNIDRGDRARVLDLLTIEVEDGALNLLFAGGAAISLEIQRIRGLVRDVGEPWPTQWRPQHSVAEGGQG